MQVVAELAPIIGNSAACRAMGFCRGALTRHQSKLRRRAFVGPPSKPKPARKPSALRLNETEQAVVLQTLCSDRFVDTSPAAVFATLLDEGTYIGSIRTMYRLLSKHAGSRERRRQAKHPVYAKPELLATGPNQVWSWDITKLKGPRKWTYFHLYVIMDIFSRYVVGWLIAPRESEDLAQELIEQTVLRQAVPPGTLTLHADRGASMRSKSVASLLVDLDVAKSHSRPYTSDDNPYSEAQFKTLKYHPQFPERFGSIEDARTFCIAFFRWYNQAHCHSGIAYLTPNCVHTGQADAQRKIRQESLDAAFAAKPLRFKGKRPLLPPMPTAAWINPPPQEPISSSNDDLRN